MEDSEWYNDVEPRSRRSPYIFDGMDLSLSSALNVDVAPINVQQQIDFSQLLEEGEFVINMRHGLFKGKVTSINIRHAPNFDNYGVGFLSGNEDTVPEAGDTRIEVEMTGVALSDGLFRN